MTENRLSPNNFKNHKWHPSDDEPRKWRQFSDDQLLDLLRKRVGFAPPMPRANLIASLEGL